MEALAFKKKSKRPHLVGNKHAKGKTPWNKGLKGVYIPSIETRKKLSDSHKGLRNHNFIDGKSRYRLEKQEEKAERKRPEQCEVCGAIGTICFDHDHATGKFRGWICNRCNLVLGLVKDNSESLMKLAEYLRYGVKGVQGHDGDEEDLSTFKKN